MRHRLIPFAILSFTAAVIFVATIAWPTVALVGGCVTAGEGPRGGFTYSTRQLGLFWRSVWLSAGAVSLCLPISLPGAYAVGRMRSLSTSRGFAASMLCLVLCPPTVYAFGWARLLPAWVPGQARCIGIWALWAWPIASALLGLAWLRGGRDAFESACLVTSPRNAYVRVALPLLSPYVALSVLVLFILFFSDYGVPHASLLVVYSTELLTWASSSARPIDVVWPALPGVILTSAALCVMAAAWRRGAHCAATSFTTPASGVGWLARSVLGCVFVVSWLVPMCGLLSRLSSPRVLAEAFRVYHADLGWSLGTAGLAGLLCIWMGSGVVASRVSRLLAVIWALVFGALPGALVGQALVAAYDRPETWWVYDSWIIVTMCYVGRFAWIGMLVAVAARRSTPQDMLEQAGTDGADLLGTFWNIQIPTVWATLVCGAGAVGALSTAEVAASSLVRIPSFSPVSQVVFEKFHRFEDDMLVSLSLLLVAVALVPCVLFLLAVGHPGRGWKRGNQGLHKSDSMQ